MIDNTTPEGNYGSSNTTDELILEVNGKRYAAPSLDRLRRYLTDYQDVSTDARALAVQCQQYYDGDAYTEATAKKLEAMGLPSKSLNKVRKVVNSNVSIILNQRNEPLAVPRNANAKDAADVATKLLRFAVDKSNIKKKRPHLIEDYLVKGIAAVHIGDAQDSVPINPIRWSEFFYDPRSVEYDFSDALYMGYAKWMEPKTVRKMFPEAMERLNLTNIESMMQIGEAYRDTAAEWMNPKDRTMLVVEVHFKVDGTWVYATFCHNGILDLGERGYKDDGGKSLCPILAQSCYVKGDPEGKHDRYGIVKDLISIQDEYVGHKAMANFASRDRRVQQVDINAPAVKSDIVRREAARTNGVIPMGWNVVGDSRFSESSALLALSEREFQENVPGPETLGLSGAASQSGVSRQIAQQQGMTVIGPILQRISDFESRIYETLWYRIKQFWKEEMDVRVTGQENGFEFLKVNVPIIEIVREIVIDPETNQPTIMEGPKVVGMEQEVASMYMDIMVKTTNENINLEHEAFENFIRYSQGVPPGSPEWMMILEIAPSWPGKREKLEEIKKMLAQTQQQAQPQPDPAAQQAQQAQMEMQGMMAQAQAGSVEARTQKDMAHAAKLAAEAEAKAQENALNTLLASRLL